MIDFIVTNAVLLLAFAVGVVCGAAVPSLTRWGVRIAGSLRKRWTDWRRRQALR